MQTHSKRTRKTVGRTVLKSRSQLWIRTAAGPSIGFGHLKRSLILARQVNGIAAPLFLLDPWDHFSRNQVQAAGFEYTNFDHVLSIQGESSPAGLLVDTRERRGMAGLVRDLQRRSIPVISIHDLGLAPLPSDIVIDGSLSPGNSINRRNGTCYYTGPDYMVIDPSTADRNQYRPMPGTASIIAVGLGGGDTGSCFHKVLEALRRTGRELSVVGIPGYSSWGQEALSVKDWSPLRFRWADPRCLPADLMGQADMAITAGGLMAFEALCVGVPLCALSLDRFQNITVRELCRAGACVDLGRGSRLAPRQASNVLKSVLGDRALRERLSRSGKRIVDGRGTERVATILRNAIRPRKQKGQG